MGGGGNSTVGDDDDDDDDDDIVEKGDWVKQDDTAPTKKVRKTLRAASKKATKNWKRINRVVRAGVGIYVYVYIYVCMYVCKTPASLKSIYE